MAIKRVFSAGGIVLRYKKDKSLEILVTQHSGHKGWDFPKGHIEVGESSKDAAIREVQEETGVIAEIVEKVGDSKYFYFEGKEKVFKTVIYYLMQYMDMGEATTAYETSDMAWLLPDEVEDKLSFQSSKKIWSVAKEKVAKMK